MTKRCCKNIDITNTETITPFIEECLRRHKRRHDFKRLILKHGFTEKDYENLLNGADNALQRISTCLAKEIAENIKNRNIPLFKTWATKKYDFSSCKERLIGNETCLQRLYDYVAVRSCAELWHRKLVENQCSSIPNRGQVYGMKLIRHYVLQDNRSMRYAKKHGHRYTRKCKYFVKLDLHHCYESIDRKLLLERLAHDIKNDDILYLWECLLKSYESSTQGLLIGALPSQYLSQYMVASIYRCATENNAITHMIVYMDDMLLFSSNRRKLLNTVKELIRWTKHYLKLSIKENFSIKRLDKEPIDMMGYVIHSNGKVTVREKSFLRLRRQMIRFEKNKCMSFRHAKRVVSYKGFLKHSNCARIKPKYYPAIKYAQNIISLTERGKLYGICDFKQ